MPYPLPPHVLDSPSFLDLHVAAMPSFPIPSTVVILQHLHVVRLSRMPGPPSGLGSLGPSRLSLTQDGADFHGSDVYEAADGGSRAFFLVFFFPVCVFPEMSGTRSWCEDGSVLPSMKLLKFEGGHSQGQRHAQRSGERERERDSETQISVCVSRKHFEILLTIYASPYLALINSKDRRLIIPTQTARRFWLSSLSEETSEAATPRYQWGVQCNWGWRFPQCPKLH